MDQHISELLRFLPTIGWTPRDFAGNQLFYAYSQVSGMEASRVEEEYLSYWRTVAHISALFQKAGIFHVILKTRRHYPYADTNVDVFVLDSDWPRARDALCRSHWRMPSRAVLMKQSMIEREKVKLPPRDEGFVPAHMYLAVSWRYQREVSFLDLEMIDSVPLTDEAPQLETEWGGVQIPMPRRAADILLHAAEIVFENYRITLGEVLYLQWLLENTPEDDQRRVIELGGERGASVALKCALAQTVPVSGGLSTQHYRSDAWPRNLPWTDLLHSWRERFRTQLQKGKVLAGIEEFFGYTAFASMYGAKRRLFE